MKLTWHPNSSQDNCQGSIKYITKKDFDEIVENQEKITQIPELEVKIAELENYNKQLTDTNSTIVKANTKFAESLETCYNVVQRIRDERNEGGTILEQVKELLKQSKPYDQNLGIKLKKLVDPQEKVND